MGIRFYDFGLTNEDRKKSLTNEDRKRISIRETRL